MQQMTSKKADILLIITTLCWGLSFTFVDMCLGEMKAFPLIAFRFCGAFLLIGLFSFKRVRRVNRKTVKWAFLCGIFLFLTYICSTIGVMHTTVSNAGFLCALTSVFIVIFEFLIYRRMPGRSVAAALLVCLAGVALLTLGDDFGIRPENIRGDVICIFCNVFYAINLMMIERALQDDEVDAYCLGAYQLFFTGIFSLAISLASGGLDIPESPSIRGALIFLTVFSTGVAFLLSTIAQKFTPAAHAGIIFNLEPVFSAIAAAFILHEILMPRNYAGAALLLFSVVILQLPLKREHRD